MLQSFHKIRRVILFIFIIAAVILLTALSDMASASVRNTLDLCYTSVIPSLFPFLVLSAMATKTATVFSGSLNGNTIILIPFILGALCGFPVGAVSIAILYRSGIIPKKKAEYLCALCNNTGPAFIIGIIGKSFWRSTSAGIILYICQILSSLIVFWAWYFLLGKRRLASNDDSCQVISDIDLANSANADFSFCSVFCSSVKESSISVIRICSFITFFKMICDIIHSFSSSETLFVILSSVLEFTTGSLNAAKLGGALGMGICGFSIAFSGLSVIAQSADFLYSVGLSALPLIRLKFVSGLLCGILTGFIFNFATFDGNVSCETFSAIPLSPIAVITPIIIALSLIIYLAHTIIKLIHR